VSIKGRVLDKATGKPVQAMVKYFAFPDNPRVRDASGIFIGTLNSRTLDDGSFTVFGLPGRGLITVRAYDNRFFMMLGLERIKNDVKTGSPLHTYPPCEPWEFHALAEVNLTEDGKSAPCTFMLDPGTTVSGTVLGPDGKPSGDVVVQNIDGHGRGEYLPTAQFTVKALARGERRSLYFQHVEKPLGAATPTVWRHHRSHYR
jgi:hypothetical protein